VKLMAKRRRVIFKTKYGKVTFFPRKFQRKVGIGENNVISDKDKIFLVKDTPDDIYGDKWIGMKLVSECVELTPEDIACIKSAINHNREWGLDQKHTEALLKKLEGLE